MAEAFGMLAPGNIDLATRPIVRNPDGSISTVRTIGVNIDGREVLVPTIADDGTSLSETAAIDQFRRTGKHLGMFKTPEQASAMARLISQHQAAVSPPPAPGGAFGFVPPDLADPKIADYVQQQRIAGTWATPAVRSLEMLGNAASAVNPLGPSMRDAVGRLAEKAWWPARAAQLEAEPGEKQAMSVLPLMTNERGDMWLTPNAGIPGSVIRGIGLAGDVRAGKARIPHFLDVPQEEMVETPAFRLAAPDPNSIAAKVGLNIPSMRKTTLDEGMSQIADLVGVVAGGGVPAASALSKAGEVSLGIVPVDAAKAFRIPQKVPDTDLFRAAVQNTPGASIDESGALRVSMKRSQKPEQELEPSVRGGVFYLPEGKAAKNVRHYSDNTNTGSYGGSQRIEGETAFKAPLFVKGATGGIMPENAYKQLMGKDAFAEMRHDSYKHMGLPMGQGKDLLVRQFLEKYAPEMADQADMILANSRKGNQLPYALREAAIGSALRRHGYDGAVGYSMGRDKQPFLSEVFDVRERAYPGPRGEFETWPEGQFGGATLGSGAVDELVQARASAATAAKNAAELRHGVSKIKLPKPIDEMTSVIQPTANRGADKVINPADLQGSRLVPLIGDRTASGGDLLQVNGFPFEKPVPLQGGPAYMRDTDMGWASQYVPAKKLQNIVTAEGREGAPVYGAHMAMGERSGDFAHMTSGAVAEMLKHTKVPRAGKQLFDQEMRNAGVVDWPGVGSEKLGDYLAQPGTGEARKLFLQKMDTARYQKMGFPSVAEARVATTDPRLLHERSGAAGLTMARMEPGAELGASGHLTYDTGIPGQYAGGLAAPVPQEVMFPKMTQALQGYIDQLDGYKPRMDYLIQRPPQGLPRSELADQQWVDSVSKHLEDRGFTVGSGATEKRGQLGALGSRAAMDAAQERAIYQRGQGIPTGKDAAGWNFKRPEPTGFARDVAAARAGLRSDVGDAQANFSRDTNPLMRPEDWDEVARPTFTLGSGATDEGGQARTAAITGARNAAESKQLDGMRKYYSQRRWSTEEEARQQIRDKIIRENANTNSFFPPTDPAIADQLTFVRSGNGVKVSQAGIAPKRAAIEILDEPTGTAPAVDWTARDNIHRGSAESAFKEYGRGRGEARQGYISMDAVPKEGLAGGRTGYDWSELRSGGAPPPVTIRLNKNGTASIMDGNHRIAYWREQGYEQVPAFIIDERPTSTTLGSGSTDETGQLRSAAATAGMDALNARAAGTEAAATGDRRGLAGGARGVPEAQDQAARVAAGAEPLAGLPQKPLNFGGDHYVPGPIGSIRKIAEDYMAGTGRTYDPPKQYHPIDKEHSTAIAKAFDEMKHAPDDPAVKASYDALIDETLAQYQAIKKSGLKIEFIKPGMEDPYFASPRLAAMDVADNNHLWVFPTESGFGTVSKISDNPMLRPTDEVVDGHKLVANDVFRIVHDYFGHLKEGHGFRAAGEDNAWRAHSSMYSDLARPAMTTETRGQNSWVNYGPHGDKNRTANAAETVFADQKVGIMPEWTMRDRGSQPPMIAYHGSPHKHGKFDMSKVGIGEGQQAFGHGMYFAQAEGVAKHYRDILAADKEMLQFAGKPLDTVWNETIRERWAPELKKVPKADRDDLVSALSNVAMAERMDEIPGIIASFNQTQRRLFDTHIMPQLLQAERNPGALYQVALDINPEHLLKWEKKLGEQTPYVQGRVAEDMVRSAQSQMDAIRRVLAKGENPNRYTKPTLVEKERARFGRMQEMADQTPEQLASDLTGQQIYTRMGLPAKDQQEGFVKATSELLKRDIPGLQYKDAASRPNIYQGTDGWYADVANKTLGPYAKQATALRNADKQAKNNYVVFDDKLIRILKRYGILLPGAAAGAELVGGGFGALAPREEM